MKRSSSLFATLTLVGTVAVPLSGQGAPPLPITTSQPSQADKTVRIKALDRLPLAFERNQGQTDDCVRFLAHTNDSTLFLTPSEAVFSMPTIPLGPDRKRSSRAGDRKAHRAASPNRSVALRMQMVGADPKATALFQQPLAGRVNYLLGNDPKRWHTDVPTFGKVGFHGVYRGVDLVYYGNRKRLEYDFIVAPHADPTQIRLHFAGATGVHIDKTGVLVVRTTGRDLTWQKPVVYQEDTTGRHAVAAHFRLKKTADSQIELGFALGHYDTTRPLVIDPVLTYSTYLGGSSSGNNATGVAVDSSGYAYVTGYTSSSSFPTTSGAFQTTYHGPTGAGSNVFVTKFNATGTALLYSTYLGGSSHTGDTAYSIAVDSSGSAYVTGQTFSSDFPVTPGAYQPTFHGGTSGFADGFATKLNTTGTGLVYSTYLGANADDWPRGIAVDSSGYAYVTGFTSSTNFPTTSGAFQTTYHGTGGAYDGFITKLNTTGTGLIYSTYLAGSSGAEVFAIAVDSSGYAYVTGYTGATDFPTTSGAFQPTATGTQGFITKLNTTGTALTYSTYLGGTVGYIAPETIAIDGSGNAYVAGDTNCTDMPVTSGAFQTTLHSSTGPNAFVTKLNATGTALLYSTFLGGSGPTDIAYGVAVDGNGYAYVAGTTSSSDFPTTIGAFQRSKTAPTGQPNAFLTRLNTTGTALLYSTYLGGTTYDQAEGIALNGSNTVVVTGYTASSDFPTTSGAFQTTNTVNHFDAFVTKLFASPIFPDFNSDGNVDLILQSASTSVIQSWFMQGATKLGGATFSVTPSSDLIVMGAGDFSGNGSTSLLLQSNTTNQTYLWYTSGTNLATITGADATSVTPASGYSVVGIGDFNGDGKSDLVFQNSSTGQIAIWYMNGKTVAGSALVSTTPSSGYKVVGVGDFNGDGFPDLVFQNASTGQIAIWYMQGATYLSGTLLTTVPASGYAVVAVGDYNGDGNPDLVFQNTSTYAAAIWYIVGGAYSSGASLSTSPGSGVKIVGPR